MIVGMYRGGEFGEHFDYDDLMVYERLDAKCSVQSKPPVSML